MTAKDGGADADANGDVPSSYLEFMASNASVPVEALKHAAARQAAGAAHPFPNAAHIRSIRYDFERPPATVAVDMENRTHDSPTAGLAENSAAGWARLAGQVQTRGQRGGDVYIASDNAPARNALAHHIVARNNVTACYVPRTPGHSSYHTARADDVYSCVQTRFRFRANDLLPRRITP